MQISPNATIVTLHHLCNCVFMHTHTYTWCLKGPKHVKRLFWHFKKFYRHVQYIILFFPPFLSVSQHPYMYFLNTVSNTNCACLCVYVYVLCFLFYLGH